MITNPDRLLPSRQLIHRELASGKLGDVGLVRIHRWEPLGTDCQKSELPDPLLRDLDLALWLVGQSANLVYAVESPHAAEATNGGRFIQVHLGFAGNRMALIDYCSRLPPGEGYSSLSVIGSSGAAYADDHQNMQLVFRGGPPQAVRTCEGTSYLQGVVNSELLSDRDRQATLALAAAVQESLDTRQAVPLEEA